MARPPHHAPNRRIPFATVLLLCLLVRSFACCAEEPINGTDALQALVRQLVDVRRETGRASAQWREQQASLAAERDLLAAENERLTQLLASRETAAAEAEQADAGTRRALADRKASLEKLALPLAEAETRLRSLSGQLPPERLAPLREVMATLPPAHPSHPADDLTERLRNALAVLTELQKQDQLIHATRIMLSPPNGSLREMNVLFVGLAMGFAVDQLGETAAIGTTTPDGWRWRWDATLAPFIRKALTIHAKEAPADFVELPLAIREER